MQAVKTSPVHHKWPIKRANNDSLWAAEGKILKRSQRKLKEKRRKTQMAGGGGNGLHKSGKCEDI